MEINLKNIKKNKKDPKYTVLCRRLAGFWIAVGLPKDYDIVQVVGGSRIYKMNSEFGVTTPSVSNKSNCSEKSLVGDFLIVHPDSSLTTLKKSEYLAYFPKQPVVEKEGTVNSNVLKDKEYLTNLKKNS